MVSGLIDNRVTYFYYDKYYKKNAPALDFSDEKELKFADLGISDSILEILKKLNLETPTGTQAKPAIFAPKNVQSVRMQLNALDQQLGDSLLLAREELIPHRTDALHGNDDLGFVQTSASRMFLARAPDSDQDFRRAQRTVDLLQYRCFDLGCRKGTNIHDSRIERRASVSPLMQVGHVVAVEPAIFLAGEMMVHALSVGRK